MHSSAKGLVVRKPCRISVRRQWRAVGGVHARPTATLCLLLAIFPFPPFSASCGREAARGWRAARVVPVIVLQASLSSFLVFPSFLAGEKLREIGELPEWCQPGFKGMKALNRIQSKVCDTALFSSEVSHQRVPR